MTPLSELISGQQFYFPFDRGTIYTITDFVKRKDGSNKAAKITTPGKLYPIYLTVKCRVIILNKSKIN